MRLTVPPIKKTHGRISSVSRRDQTSTDQPNLKQGSTRDRLDRCRGLLDPTVTFQPPAGPLSGDCRTIPGEVSEGREALLDSDEEVPAPDPLRPPLSRGPVR